MKLKKKDEGGIYIFPDLIADERLNWLEKALLSTYRLYTEYGDGSCHMEFEKLNEKNFGGTLNKSNYHRAKRHLKERGLIETDGGIIVKSVRGGVKNDTGGVKNDTHIK